MTPPMHDDIDGPLYNGMMLMMEIFAQEQPRPFGMFEAANWRAATEMRMISRKVKHDREYRRALLCDIMKWP